MSNKKNKKPKFPRMEWSRNPVEKVKESKKLHNKKDKEWKNELFVHQKEE